MVLTRLDVVVGASPDKFVQYYQVEAKLTTDTDYTIIGKGTQLNYSWLNVLDDKTYDVRVKAINALGVSSSYTSGTRKIIGGTETPNNVTDLSVSMVGSNQMELTWSPVSDLDISWYEIRYQNVSSGATWAESTPLTKVVRRKSDSVTVNQRQGAFLIKAVDKLANSSAMESIVYTNIAQQQAFIQTQTFNE